MKWWDQMPWSLFFGCWVLSQLFHSLFLFHQEALQFLLALCPKGGVICISEAIDISPSNFESSLCSSGPTYLRMYSAYNLNKQGDNIQTWGTNLLIWNQLIVRCLFLTIASWPAYRFLRRQVRWSGIPISFRIFHSLLWSTQSKALTQSRKQSICFSGTLLIFLWSKGRWQLIYVFSAFSKPSLSIWNFSVHVLLKTHLENFEHYFARVFSSVQFSGSVMFDSLWPYGLQHMRPSSPSPTPRDYRNSFPLSRWCHPTISSSVVPFSSCLQSFTASGTFQRVTSLHHVAKVLEFQLQHQSFQWIFRTDFL